MAVFGAIGLGGLITAVLGYVVGNLLGGLLAALNIDQAARAETSALFKILAPFVWIIASLFVYNALSRWLDLKKTRHHDAPIG